MLFLFYLNVSEMRPRSYLSSQSLTIPALWVFLRVGWSISLVLPWMTASHFLVGNSEAELKPSTFSSLLLFRVFLSFLFSSPSSDIVPLSATYWGYHACDLSRISQLIPRLQCRYSHYAQVLDERSGVARRVLHCSPLPKP